MKLTILVPVHNEEENILKLISSIECEIDLPFELIVINDHSIDGTAGIVLGLAKTHSNIKLVDNNLAPGFANALITGFSNVNTEVVVPVMGDLCDDLKTIPVMFNKIKEGYDIICGSRYVKGGARMGRLTIKGFFSRFVGRSLFLLIGIPTSDISNAFKMYRKKVLDSINIESKGFEISMELPLKAFFSGFKIAEVPTVWYERKKGKSNFKTINLAPDYLRWYLWGLIRKIRG